MVSLVSYFKVLFIVHTRYTIDLNSLKPFLVPIDGNVIFGTSDDN